MLGNKRARARGLAGVVVAVALVAGTAVAASAGSGHSMKVLRPTGNADAYKTTLAGGTSLEVGAQIYLGVKVLIPGEVESVVSRRNYRACKTLVSPSLVTPCMTGSIVYAPEYAVCGTTCTIIGYRGTHACLTSGSSAYGYTDSVTSCGTYWGGGSFGKQWEQDKICVYTNIACKTGIWHVNAYWNGSITGPYAGPGAS